jgi:membrane associated rhomboid family serine protease
MLCPRCRTPLQATLEPGPAGRLEIDVCATCRGIWFDGGELAQLTRAENSEVFDLHSPLFEGDTPSVPCPRHADTRMLERELATARVRAFAGTASGEAAAEPLKIDQCPKCSGLWFDGGEVEALAKTLRESRMAPFLVDPNRSVKPTSTWLWLFMLLTGLPIEGGNPRHRRPVCMYTLLALCVLGFFWQLTTLNPESTVQLYGLVPDQLRAGYYLPLLTHMFLHGGLVHLLGNLYFLYVFGDNVEDRLGASRFLMLYFLSGLGAAVLHSVLTDRSDIPVIGASGAIAGIMGAYAVLFPRARLVSLIIIFSVRWKTATYLVIWLIYQIIGAAMGVPGIAWWAHIGGFFVGGAIAWPFRLGVARGPNDKSARPPVLPPAASSTSPPSSDKKLEWH